MRQSILQILIALLLLGALGGGGWMIFRKQRELSARLHETQASLETKRTALTTLEEEHRHLSDDYEALKTRWTKADSDLQELIKTSAQTKDELTTVSTERADLQRQLQEATKDRDSLKKQSDRLRQDITAAERARSAVETQLSEAAGHSLTLSEIEQLSQTLRQQREEAASLNERMEALSHAFEQLAWKHIELEEGMGSSDQADGQPAANPIEKARAEAKKSRQLAQQYDQAGEVYLATYQYPKAAEAFEQSLTYRDDPAVHGKLAFIYTRLLPNRDKAAYHAALAPPEARNIVALGDTPRATGLPRSNWKLVWRWLTDQ